MTATKGAQDMATAAKLLQSDKKDGGLGDLIKGQDESDKEKIPFTQYYRKANCFGRMIYSYCMPLILGIKENNLSMKEEMIIDMTLEDGETAKLVEKLLKNITIAEEQFKKENNSNKSFYVPFRNAVWATFKWEIIKSAICNFFADCCSIGYTSFLKYLIEWLRDDDATIQQGAIYLAIFFAFMCGSTMFR